MKNVVMAHPILNKEAAVLISLGRKFYIGCQYLLYIPTRIYHIFLPNKLLLAVGRIT